MIYFDIFINLFETALIGIFLYHCVTIDRNNSIFRLVLYILISFVSLTYVNMSGLNETLFQLYSVCLNFLFLSSVTNQSVQIRAIFSIIPLICISISNMPMDVLLSEFLYGRIDYSQLAADYYIPATVFIQVIHAALFFLIVYYLKKRKIILTGSDQNIILGLMIVLVILNTALANLVYTGLFRDMDISITLYCILGLVILIIMLFDNMIVKNRYESDQELEIKILQEELKNNQKQLVAQEKIYQMRHDIKHLISLLPGIDNTEDEALREKISRYKNEYQNMNIPVHSNSGAVNYVVNIKRQEATDLGIDFICALNIVNEIPVDREDLCLILSNLLDNAIRHIGLRKRLLLEMNDDNERLFLRITNSIDFPVLDKNGEIHALQSEEHGYGIFSVRQLVKKYDGRLHYTEDGENLITLVLIPLKYDKKEA